MNSIFNEKILADKLSKLNGTQQCIETLSHWCIFHREKADIVVETWDKQFHVSQKEQKIPFLYLANDIIQNSRRKGTEFVSEFWKVLPAALKVLVEDGGENARNVVSRLVTIWEERKVFGSKAKGLKDLMLGHDPLPPLEFNKKRSSSVKILRRGSRSVKIKLTTGGTAEKIVSAFQSVISEHANESVEMNKCKSAIRRVRRKETDIDIACSQGGSQRETLANELQKEESLLKECIEKLKSSETIRVALVTQLQEALKEQESELENIRTQMQVAHAQAEEASKMRRRLLNETVVDSSKLSSSVSVQEVDKDQTIIESSKKTAATIAAEVADKLAASTSSQQIMTSVLSTFAAEEAKSAGLKNVSNSPDLRPRIEPPAPSVGSNSTFMVVQNPYVQVQQASTSQHQFALLTAPPPSQQYSQQTGGLLIGVPYGYNRMQPPSQPMPPSPMSTQAPPPPLPSVHLVNFSPVPQPPPMPIAPQPIPMVQQQSIPPNFRPLQPPNMTFYTHPHPYQ